MRFTKKQVDEKTKKAVAAVEQRAQDAERSIRRIEDRNHEDTVYLRRRTEKLRKRSRRFGVLVGIVIGVAGSAVAVLTDHPTAAQIEQAKDVTNQKVTMLKTEWHRLMKR